jgi:hypothetical protein
MSPAFCEQECYCRTGTTTGAAEAHLAASVHQTPTASRVLLTTNLLASKIQRTSFVKEESSQIDLEYHVDFGTYRMQGSFRESCILGCRGDETLRETFNQSSRQQVRALRWFANKDSSPKAY